MRFRKLRIAWSVGYGIVCALLLVLWWQSRNEIKGFTSHLIPHRFTMVLSLLGEVGVAHGSDWEERVQTPEGKLNQLRGDQPDIFEYSYINRGPYPNLTGKMPPFRSRLRWHRTKYQWYVGAPHWLLILCFAATGSIPWLRPSRKYSLRTLLTATTLVAVVLGLVIYAAGK